MKELKVYILEKFKISKDIKTDIESNISHINFTFNFKSEMELKDYDFTSEFKHWPQETIDNIKNIEIKSKDEGYCKISIIINIDDQKYYLHAKWDEDDYMFIITNSNIFNQGDKIWGEGMISEFISDIFYNRTGNKY